MKKRILFLAITAFGLSMFRPDGVALAEKTKAEKRAPSSDLDREFNEVCTERAELYTQVLEKTKRLANLWRNPEHGTDEIKHLRNKLAELEMEAMKVRAEIRNKVMELPEVKKMTRELERDRVKLRKLTERRNEILDQR